MHDSCFCSPARRQAASGNNAGASHGSEVTLGLMSVDWVTVLLSQFGLGPDSSPWAAAHALCAAESLRNRRVPLVLDHLRVSCFMRRAATRLSAADIGRRCSDLAGVCLSKCRGRAALERSRCNVGKHWSQFSGTSLDRSLPSLATLTKRYPHHGSRTLKVTSRWKVKRNLPLYCDKWTVCILAQAKRSLWCSPSALPATVRMKDRRGKKRATVFYLEALFFLFPLTHWSG